MRPELSGVLVEVVETVSSVEKEANAVNYLTTSLRGTPAVGDPHRRPPVRWMGPKFPDGPRDRMVGKKSSATI